MKTKFFKIPVFIFTILLICLGIIEKNPFTKPMYLDWDESRPLQLDDFKGIPNFLSGYSAEIYAFFTWNFGATGEDTIFVKSQAAEHLSWMKDKKHKDAMLLHHEQLHFDIAELIARKFRRKLMMPSGLRATNERVQGLAEEYKSKLQTLQAQYDLETDHGLKIELQKDWEYLVDSMLTELNDFKSPCISFVPQHKRYTYYRQIELDNTYHLAGKYPFEGIDTLQLNYYHFYYDKIGNIIRVEYREKGKLAIDGYFGMMKVNIAHSPQKELWTFVDDSIVSKGYVRDVYKWEITYDSRMKLIRKRNLNESGKPCSDNRGLYELTWQLDDIGRISEASFYDINGNRIADGDGYYHLKYEYENGKIAWVKNYDDKERLVVNRDGYAAAYYTYDFSGNVTSVSYFDAHLNPVNYCGHYKIKTKYNENGYLLSEAYYDTNDNIITDEYGEAYTLRRYDVYGHIIEEAHYGLNKNLVIDDKGIGRICYAYDKKGNIAEEYNYDSYGWFNNDKTGVSCRKYTYDAQNRQVKMIEIKADSVGYLKTDSAKVVHWSYDKKNSVISQYYTDLKNHYMADSSGIARYGFSYDYGKKITMECYYNEKNKRMKSPDSVYQSDYYYKGGNVVELQYRNLSGQLMKSKMGYAIEKNSFTYGNKVASKSYFGTDGKPVLNNEGIAVAEYSYNKSGNILEESYFGVNHQPVRNKKGFHKVVYQYDQFQQVSQVGYFNENNLLTTNAENKAALEKYVYSSSKQLIESLFYNAKAELTLNNEGFAIKQFILEGDKVTVVKFYGPDQRLINNLKGFAQVKIVYDNSGNIILRRNFDKKGKPATDEFGYSAYTFKYNRNRQITHIEKFKVNEINKLPKIARETDNSFLSSHNFEYENNTGKNAIVSQSN